MKFIEVHSLDSNRAMLVNTRFIAEVEQRPGDDEGVNLWLATDSGAMRLIRITQTYDYIYSLLDAT